MKKQQTLAEVRLCSSHNSQRTEDRLASHVVVISNLQYITCHLMLCNPATLRCNTIYNMSVYFTHTFTLQTDNDFLRHQHKIILTLFKTFCEVFE